MTKPTLSYSRISCYNKCHRKYYWRYIENLAPIKKADYFQTGIVVHDLRDEWVQGKLEAKDVAELRERVAREFPSNDPEVTEQVALESASLFVGYTKAFRDDDYELISPEMHLEKDFGDFKLYARLDALAKDPHGKVFRDELKTTKQMNSAYLQGLARGLQTGIAYWLCDELLPEKVRGTLFEIIVKTKIPQYKRNPVIRDEWCVRYAKQAVYGMFNDVSQRKTKEDFYPSLDCNYGKYTCEYETLCRNDTEAKREAFFQPYHKE